MKVPHSIVGRTDPAQRQPRGYVSDAGASPAAFGLAVAQGLQGVGQAVSARGDILRQREDQTQRFDTLKNFGDFTTSVGAGLTEMKRNAAINGQGFTKAAEDYYTQQEQQFLSRVPPEQAAEFRFRSSQVKNGIFEDALKFQYEVGDRYFRQGVSDMLSKGMQTLDQDPKQLDLVKQQVAEAIDATDLSEVEKATLKREALIGLESTTYKAEVKAGAIAAGAIGVGNLNEDVSNIIEEEAAAEGVDPQAMKIVAYLESGGRINARNSQSSAGGLFQQIDSNAKQYGVTNRFDPRQSARGAAKFMKENTVYLRRLLGREPTVGELYLAHQQGPGGAAKLLSNPNALAVDVVGYDHVMKNGGAPGMTAQQFANKWISKAEGVNPTFSGQLDADPRFSNIPYETRLALRDDADREAAAITAERLQQERAARDQQLNQLMLGLYDGKKGQVDIDNAREDGLLSEINQVQQAQNILAQRTAGLQYAREGAEKLLSGSVFDPYSDDDKKRLNAVVGKQGLSALEGMDKQWVSGGLVPIVNTAQDIPGDVAGLLTGMARNGDAQKSIFALDVLRQMQEIAPDAYKMRISEDMRRQVDFFNARKNTMPHDELLSKVRGGTDSASRQAAKILDQEAKQLLARQEKGIPNLERLTAEVVEELDGEMPRAAMARQGLYSDYQTAFTEQYRLYGTVEEAHKMAVQDLKKYWGATSVGGNSTVMRYPVEKMGYKKHNGDYGWIDKQVRQELNIPESSTFELLSDDQTLREFQEGKPPSYKVVEFREDGAAVYKGDKNSRRYFQPDQETLRLEEEGFARDVAESRYRDAVNELAKAQNFLAITGTPVPQELIDNVERLKQEWEGQPPDPEAPPSFGQTILDYMTGPGAN